MYSLLTVRELQAELRRRKASVAGKKAALIERLEAYDRNQNFGDDIDVQDDQSYTCPASDTFRDINADSSLPNISRHEIQEYIQSATEYETQGEKLKTEKRDKVVGVQKLKKEVQKRSNSAQTDFERRESSPLNFRTMFNNIFDGVGPWIPYIGGSAILLMLLGLLTNNVDVLVGMFDIECDEKSSSTGTAPSAPVLPPPDDSCKAKCAFRVNKNRIKWPDT